MKDSDSRPMLTAAEAEVMNVVWDQQVVSVADIVERLPRNLAYTTVLTTVRILEEKGFVRRRGKRGRAYLYEPEVDRNAVRGNATREIARRLFGGSLKALALNLVRDDSISEEDLAEVKRIIEQFEERA